jgi:hypothetical protein
MSTYPETPGSKGDDGTSQDAAKAIAPNAKTLRRKALTTLLELGTGTPLEVTSKAKAHPSQFQPRFSELKAMGLVAATGERRKNPSGKMAAVLALTERGKEALK